MEETTATPAIRAFNDLPFCAIPLLDQRATGTGAVDVGSYRPDIACRNHCYSVEEVVVRSDVGAVNDAPTGAIPVFGQRLKDTVAIGVGSHGPDVVL